MPAGPPATRNDRLRAQALAALRELLAGVGAAGRPDPEGLYPALVTAVLRMVAGLLAKARGLPAVESFAHPAAPEPLAAPESALQRARACLLVVDGEPVRYQDLDVEHLGVVYEGLLGFEVRAAPDGGLALHPTEDRRRLGAHYTSRALTRVVVARALAPLLPDTASPEEVLSLKVCDPAMGSGAFLLEACRTLADHLVRAWERASAAPPSQPGEAPLLTARRLIAARCLYGVDKDPLAVELARASLRLLVSAQEEPSLHSLTHALRAGDSLLGLTRRQRRDLPDAARLLDDLRGSHRPFQWETELPEVFEERGGFDAVLGNPPWVSYAGRAAQPLAPELRAFYLRTSPAFAGYRNLQALFVHRAATLLRPGGRLGLVLPTSMSDLAGYEPSRRAHDALCACDPDLPDFGDAFDDVFQPSMALLSTRRPSPVTIEEAGPWPLERRDLDPDAAALLTRLSALPRLPPHLFGERGFQTSAEDVKQLVASASPAGRFNTGVRVGGDIEPSLRRPPRLHCDPADFNGRFRPEAEWREVKLLIRQTARYPMVALSDGGAFRNSILAGFEDEAHSAAFLLAYLNSSPLRWVHYVRHRDARQGMPQVKIGHLRALPDLPPGVEARAELERIGAELAARNTGITPAEQARIDALAADGLSLDEAERRRIAAWAASTKG